MYRCRRYTTTYHICIRVLFFNNTAYFFSLDKKIKYCSLGSIWIMNFVLLLLLYIITYIHYYYHYCYIIIIILDWQINYSFLWTITMAVFISLQPHAPKVIYMYVNGANIALVHHYRKEIKKRKKKWKMKIKTIYQEISRHRIPSLRLASGFSVFCYLVLRSSEAICERTDFRTESATDPNSFSRSSSI